MVSTFQKFVLVIECTDTLNNKSITLDNIVHYYNENTDIYKFYALILHDKDVNESGEIERKHLHLVLVTHTSKSCKSIINDIAKYLFVNVNCISCKGCFDFIQSVQYLIHLNDKDKYQYQFGDIYTSDLIELSNIIYEGHSSYDIDIDYLINLVESSKKLSDVYRVLGLNKSRLYRALIADIWKGVHNG